MGDAGGRCLRCRLREEQDTVAVTPPSPPHRGPGFPHIRWLPSGFSSGPLTVTSLVLPKSLDRPEVTRLISRRINDPTPAVQQRSNLPAGPAGRACCASPPPRLPLPRPAPRGAGLTTQHLLAARAASLGPGHRHEARPATLRGLGLGVTLHRDAPHRHGALFTHAVLAVADPLLSGLEQSRRGSPRAPGRCPGLSSCSAQQQARSALGPPLWPLLWSSCCDTPVTRPGTPPPQPAPAPLPRQSRPLPQEGARSLLPLERGGARWGHNHSRIWETRLVPRRLEEKEKGRHWRSWGLWPGGRGPGPQGHAPSVLATPPAKAAVLPPGTGTWFLLKGWPQGRRQDRLELAWDGGWSDAEAGPAQDRGDRLAAPRPVVPSTRPRAPVLGGAYGTRAHRCRCRS